ncbi:MAG: Gfo/Idh/MocA family oxidoreductase [Cytophagaceae bacterium]|nr:Gfo/Idh/MocA family oxidoreductase [Gemmatimonadaceae bacterium]
MGKPLRWGILGAANIAIRQVIPGIQKGASGTVVAIASRTGVKAEQAARDLGIPRAHGSYEALIEDAEVDAIYNPLPNHLHVPWSVKAADAGKHVLCEKPIGLNAQEVLELIDARDRNKVVVGEAFMVRAQPRWLAVKRLVAEGRIGEVGLIVGHFSYNRRDPNDVRSHLEWGGGALLDVGSYPITLSRWLFGEEPTEVVALIERDPEFGIDRLTSAILRFPRGQASFTCAGQLVLHQRFQVLGSRGRIEVEVPYNPPADKPSRLVIDEGKGLALEGAEVMEFPAVNQYAVQAEAFAAAVRGEGEVPVTLEDAMANMRVIDALFRSSETRQWERVAR